MEKARDQIQKCQAELINVVQMDIIIPAKFHNSIIGAKGRLIRSIMEEAGGVLIKFPPEGSGSDKVSIRGPKDCVAKAKQMLVELSNEKQTNSFTVEIKAQPAHHRFLIGKNGINIKKVRDSTGARVFFPTDKDDDSDTIVIVGKKEDVMKAKKELEDMIRDLEKVVEDEIRVDPKHHKHFVARKGQLLRQISDDLGGVQISFPRTSEKDSDKVTLKGSKEFVEGAKKRIQEEIERLDSLVTIECAIDPNHHRSVLGSRGSNVQSIQNKHKVQIKFPERRAANEKPNGKSEDSNSTDGPLNGDAHPSDDNLSETSDQLSAAPGTPNSRSRVSKKDVILITGRPEDCEAAKQALLASVPVETEVIVPYDYHRFIIGQKGREVRDLMERFDVNISVPHSSHQSDSIKVTGLPDNTKRAKDAILERVAQLDDEKKDREARSYKVELHIDPSFHPKIIGKRGAVITKIRTKHDVQIQFPERSSSANHDAPNGQDGQEDLITIAGYEKNAEAAKEDILKIVKGLESLTAKEIRIDPRIHPRLIGARGKTIHKIMDKFKVDIKFPRNSDPDPWLVTISGESDDVDAAADHILNLEEEYVSLVFKS